MTDNVKQTKKSYSTHSDSKGGDNQVSVQKVHVSDELLSTFRPLEVRIFGNNFDRGFRMFRTLVQKDRVLSDYKESQSYEKPSDRKRRKRNEAKRKLLQLESEKKKSLSTRYSSVKED